MTYCLKLITKRNVKVKKKENNLIWLWPRGQAIELAYSRFAYLGYIIFKLGEGGEETFFKVFSAPSQL